MLFIMVGKAEVLKLVVEAVAQVIRHHLGEGVGGVGAREVEEAPQHAGAQEGQGQEKEGTTPHIPREDSSTVHPD